MSLCLFFLNTATNAQQKQVSKPKLSAVPVINYDPSYGGVFGAFAALYFPMNKKDTISPASCAGGGGMYTTNKTWFAFGFAKLYYHNDLFRTVVAGGFGEQNFQYFNENYGVSGSFISYSTLINFFYAEQMVNVYTRWYTGIDFTFYKANTTFNNEADTNGAVNYVALGIPITFDSRDNIQNPGKGRFVNIRMNRYDSLFGSATEYTKLDIDASKFFSKVEQKIIAAKVSLSTAVGTVPFEAQTIVGGKVLRGYSKGEYRGDQVYALQGEYRWNFYKKLGAVFFGGVATPVNHNESWNTDQILPAAGAGIRYMMISDLRLNVGFDVAFGKNDYGLYFRIGEAF